MTRRYIIMNDDDDIYNVCIYAYEWKDIYRYIDNSSQLFIYLVINNTNLDMETYF